MSASHSSQPLSEALQLIDKSRRVRDLATWKTLVRDALSDVPKHLRDDATEETTQDLLASLLALRRNGSAKWFEYLDLREPALRGRLKARARRLYEERDTRRRERHALAQTVRKVLERPLPDARGMPTTLRNRSKLSEARVAQAIAELLDSDDPPRREARSIAAALTRYFEPASDAMESPVDEFTEVRRAVEGRRIARRLADALTEDEFDVLTAFWLTRSYGEVAASLGCNRAEARARVARLFRRLRRITALPVAIRWGTFRGVRDDIASLATMFRALDILVVERGV